MKNKEHKLDRLFQEKLSDAEIPLEEDYWPLIEKNIEATPTSFYRFGWKHVNIYYVSSALALAVGGFLYFSNTPEKQLPEKIVPPASITTPTTPSQKEDSLSNGALKDTPKEKNTNAGNTNAPIKEKTGSSTNSSTSLNEIRKDSIVPPAKETEVEPVITPEPTKAPVEEKVKPKRIIYVVQQDTIIQKDTVKVRRKSKK